MFIHLHITQVEFVSAVLGTDMVVAASLLVIVSGCLLLLLAVFGIIISIVDRVKPYAVVSSTLSLFFLPHIAVLVQNNAVACVHLSLSDGGGGGAWPGSRDLFTVCELLTVFAISEASHFSFSMHIERCKYKYCQKGHDQCNVSFSMKH